MSIKWRKPPPPAPVMPATSHFYAWASRLVQWLREQEIDTGADIESTVAIGGPGVAERMLGFEGKITGYTPPDTTAILMAGQASPAAGKRRIIVGITIHSEGVAEVGVLQKNKNSALTVLFSFNTSAAAGNKDPNPFTRGPIVLDSIDESLEILITAGSADVHYSGAYLEVD